MEKKIAEHLQTKWAGKKIVYKASTVSTNDDAKRLAIEGAEHGTLVVADTQSGGKGRRGRIWQSPPGTTISMSLICRPEFSIDKASMLTLLMGLSVAEAVTELTGLQSEIKWPNDVVVNGKKVCGILTELGAMNGRIEYIVIGVGINVNNGINMLDAEQARERRDLIFGEELMNTATGLWLETAVEYSREKVMAACLEKFEFYYEKFVRDLDLRAMIEAYNGMLAGKGDIVRVLDPQGEYTGISKGIDTSGNLLVEVNGAVQKVYAGEVSVRGLYGYV